MDFRDDLFLRALIHENLRIGSLARDHFGLSDADTQPMSVVAVQQCPEAYPRRNRENKALQA